MTDICWNSRGIRTYLSGIERLALESSQCLIEKDKQVKQVMLLNSDMEWIEAVDPNIEVQLQSRRPLALVTPLIFKPKSKVFHSWAQPILRNRASEFISYTVHDWGPFFDKSMSKKSRKIWKHAIQMGVYNSDSIHFMSEHVLSQTPKEMISLIKQKSVILSDFQFRESLSDDELTQPKVLNEPYLLAIGSLEQRKRFHEIASIWRNESMIALTGLKLVIVGRDTEKLGIDDNVVGLGYVSERKLRNLLSNCTSLISVSTYEGLNIPVMEAVEIGKPVIAIQGTYAPIVKSHVTEILNLNATELLYAIKNLKLVSKIDSSKENILIKFLLEKI